MPPNPEAKPASLAETLQSFSPWGSRSNTPRPGQTEKEDGTKASGSVATTGGSESQQPNDHAVSHQYRLSLTSYPPDCPPPKVRWFHAVDVAKRKPLYNVAPLGDERKDDGKPTAVPKKWNAFSANDSRSIEEAFQKLAVKEDRRGSDSTDKGDRAGNVKDTNAPQGEEEPEFSVVPVNEDHLFDVSITRRELRPTYWLGPVYAVRRGIWFYSEGNNLRPVEENLAMQLEEGYLKTRPWTYNTVQQRPRSQTRGGEERDGNNSDPPKDNKETVSGGRPSSQAPSTLPSHRLFGTHMNSMVTYEDTNTAWLLSDDFLSRMTGSVYQRLRGGAHLSGTKLLRGWTEPSSKKPPPQESKRSATPPPESRDKEVVDGVQQKRNSMPATTSPVAGGGNEDGSARKPDSRLKTLERQMSSLVSRSAEQQEEENRKREEEEIQEDYKDLDDDIQDREIDHLVLVSHGIGQRLGARFEAFNFIHDVNELRKTVKNVYGASPDLQALNGEVDSKLKNSRVQVLPIVWRHLLNFPHQRLKSPKGEHDLADSDDEDVKYPSLDDITIEGVPALRNIMADVALDVLLYQSKVYHDFIAKVVVQECNRIYKLFKRRNPSFAGKVSLIGHSLGSAILFDVVSDQEAARPAFGSILKSHPKANPDFLLNFDVENLVCLGSPIGLFQMLKGHSITGRGNPNAVTLDGGAGELDDPYTGTSYFKFPFAKTKDDQGQLPISSPKCRALYNIFHPSDPIAYRLEPLISPSMSEMKPQPLPYTKNSFLGAPMGQGITAIPARVGESFTGLWTNFSSSLANNFINRSLGLSAEDAAALGAPHPQNPIRLQPQSAGAGTNITAGGVISMNATPNDGTSSAAAMPAQNMLKRTLTQQAADATRSGEQPPTLIDGEMETLFAGFQKRRKSKQESDASLRDLGASLEWRAAEQRGRELQKEEAKVRLLNANGRVDYAIQEGVFDVSLFSAIASHLSYWTDEDVCHFLISQMLSRRRRKSM